MHTIKVHTSNLPSIPKVSDGKTCKFRDNLVIDQFFGSSGNMKSTGFPASDITLLERLQRQGGTPYETLRSHMSPLQKSTSDNRKPNEIMNTQKPAWCQTPAELQAYEEQLYQNYFKTEGKSVDKVENDGKENSVPKDSSQPELNVSE